MKLRVLSFMQMVQMFSSLSGRRNPSTSHSLASSPIKSFFGSLLLALHTADDSQLKRAEQAKHARFAVMDSLYVNIHLMCTVHKKRIWKVHICSIIKRESMFSASLSHKLLISCEEREKGMGKRCLVTQCQFFFFRKALFASLLRNIVSDASQSQRPTSQGKIGFSNGSGPTLFIV